MENGEVYVGSLKQELFEDTRKRVKRVLGWEIAVGHAENGLVDCFVSTHHAQENLVKTKEYIRAISGESAGVEVYSFSLDAASVTMILSHQDCIEANSTTALARDTNTNVVNIHGTLENIFIAKTFIGALLNKGCDKGCMKNENYILSTNLQGASIPNFNAIDPEVIAEDEDINGENFGEYSPWNTTSSQEYRDGWQHGLKSRGCSIAPGPSAGNTTCPVHRCTASTDTGHVSHGQTAVARPETSSHDSSSDLSDGETSDVSELQTHADYQNKVEFAFKLGYSEGNLCRALQKLGSNASQNELLSELIQHGSSSSWSAQVHSGISRALSLDDSDGLQLYYRHKQPDVGETTNLYPIVIDGSNVAMSHGNKEVFSCRGILLAVDWFRQRGHKDVTVFVPQWRKETSRPDARIKDQDILAQLEKEKILVFTPARRIGGKRVVCYDDRYVLNLAVETNGIVVSNDNYRDLVQEKAAFKKVVEERLLMYSFVNDRFMPPDDPLGRNGPTLDNFLQKEPTQPEPLPPICPYGRKCTYGNKCKYHHPERNNQPQKSVTEKLAEQAKQRLTELKNRKEKEDGKKKLSKKQSLQRTKSVNPSELGGREALPVTRGQNGSVWGSPTQPRTREEEYRLYNERLSENLRKMEQEQQQTETQSRQSEECENQSRMRWTGSPVEMLRGPSPRGASPVSSLSVPGQEVYDDGEQFISGHLLLAKKLSDEANESAKQKQREMSNDKIQEAQSPPTPAARAAVEEPHEHGKRKQPLTKQKLSRQLSLQGQEDPRARQGHAVLQPQLSYDPRILARNQQSFAEDPAYRNSLANDFMHGQSHERLQPQMSTGPDTSSQNLYGQNINKPHYSVAREMHNTHAALTHMNSAPNPSVVREAPSRQFPRMMRQNSTSDPQLHKLDSPEQPAQQFGPLGFKDTSGSVTFQIGASQPMPHNRSVHDPFQNFSQYSSQNFELHPANVHFGSISQPANPYLRPHMVAHKPPLFGQNVAASFGPVHDMPAQGQFVFPAQRHPWDNHVAQDSNPNLAPRVHTSPGGTGGLQRGVPEDTPILGDDPRYKLYYHLCGLFPEARVRSVMNQHPEAVTPNEICAYIIGAK